MAHVKIAGTKNGAYVIEVDGVDLSKATLFDGVSVSFVGKDQHREVFVNFRVRADVLDMDLPDAQLTAIRAAVA